MGCGLQGEEGGGGNPFPGSWSEENLSIEQTS